MQPNVPKVQMALCGVGLLENFLYLWKEAPKHGITHYSDC